MRLAADAAHQFGGIALDRGKPLSFRLNGRRIAGFAGDTVLSAALAAGIYTYGTLNGQPLGLTDRCCPLVTDRQGHPLPMERTPAIDGLDLTSVGPRRRFALDTPHTLGHRIDGPADPPWLNEAPESTLAADLLIVGAGVAGLAAAQAAIAAGRRVVLIDRRPWTGGDARYFGKVGDEESPEAATVRLAGAVAGSDNCTVLLRAEVFSLAGNRALLHQVEIADGKPRGRIVAVEAQRVLLATGAVQRLPVFPGNRTPGVLPAIAAYHLAKRYGVALGRSALLATQGNHAYRLALRVHDAGIEIRRIADPRVNPQSRFIDFAKASGLTLGTGQVPLSARGGQFNFGPVAGAGPRSSLAADQLIVSGTWQPELTLWMQAGGGVAWSPEQHGLVANGQLAHVGLAGAAAGYRSMRACLANGRAMQAALFDESVETIEDTEPGAEFETPDDPTPQAPASADAPSFLDAGRTLAMRPAGTMPARLALRAHALSLADVAASVELGLIAPIDAGAIAEERGAPGADLAESAWRPTPRDVPADALPAFLVGRFGDAPQRVHLIVDAKRRFPIGALVYLAGDVREPVNAVGVIVAEAPAGGHALIAQAALEHDRFIVELGTGPSPARLATP